MDLTSRCYYVQSRDLDDEKEVDFDLGWSANSIEGKYFVCRFYDKVKAKTKQVAEIIFCFMSEDTVYIDNLERKKTKSTKGLGSKLLTDTLWKAKRRGAKFAILAVGDDGNGKLYQYYYKMGFRCIGSLEYQEGDIEEKEGNDGSRRIRKHTFSDSKGFLMRRKESAYNDFIGKKKDVSKEEQNRAECLYMRLDLSKLK